MGGWGACPFLQNEGYKRGRSSWRRQRNQDDENTVRKNRIYHRSDQLRESCALAVNGNDESASTDAQLEPNVSYLNPKIP